MEDHPHGKKLEGRVKNDEFKDERELLEEIIEHYNIFKNSCSQSNITDSNYLTQMIDHVNKYIHVFSDKKFIKIRNNSQSKIFPSIVEEFMYHLFEPIVHAPLVCGSSEVPIASHFKSYNEIISSKYHEETLCEDTINADFAIGILQKSVIKSKKEILCPFVAIEVKRYADKTMRRTTEHTAYSLKLFAPECLYLLVVDLGKSFYNEKYSPDRSFVEQTYVLQEGNKPGDIGLRYDIISRLFIDVSEHLQKVQTPISIKERLERGYMRGL